MFNCRNFLALHQCWIFSLVLAIAVFLAFSGSLKNGFVNYDDPDYITNNPEVRSGLTWSNFWWAFQTSHAGNWHPVTWLSHMLDCTSFGLNPAGHHFVSVIFHAFSAVFLFFALNEMTAAPGRSFVTAALFALHPLRVESVAWACERKDVLAAFFGTLTILLYGRWCTNLLREQSRALGYYLAALGTFVLGLMSKSVLVTLPAVLLLLDYWPLGRWRRRDGSLSARRLLLEKLPFLIIAAGAGIWTMLVQHRIGAVKTFADYPIDARVGNAVVSYCRYLLKLFYPTNLAAFYPHPVYWPVVVVIVSACFIATVSFLSVRYRQRHPYFVVGWLWYLITALPVIGLIQVGAQSMADRYTYIPSIGICMCASWGVYSAFESLSWQKQFLRVTALTVIACFAAATVRQVGYWHDSLRLFRHTIAVTEDNPVAHMNLGIALLEAGDRIRGLEELRTSVRIAPNYPDAHLALGTALADTAAYEQAISELDATLRLSPRSAKAYLEAGVVFDKMGKTVEAAKVFERAIQLEPDYADAYNDLGVVLEKLGRLVEAASEYQQALRCAPSHVNAHQNLGALEYHSGRIKEAIAEFTAASQLDPSSAAAHNNLGGALFVAGRYEDAISQYQAALKANPDFPGIQANLKAAIAAKELAK